MNGSGLLTRDKIKWSYLCEHYQDFSLIVSTLAILFGLIIIFSILSTAFFSQATLINILFKTSIYIILSVGMTMVMTTGAIDISIGSQVGLICSILGIALTRLDYPVWFGILLAIAVGALLGSFNGFLVSKVRVPAIVVTLGTMTFFRGLAYLSSGGEVFMDFPRSMVWLGQGSLWRIPVPFLIALVVMIWGQYFLKSTRSGQHITAMGGNEEASRLAGINISFHRLLVYVIMGMLTGLATIILVARINAAQSVMGDGMEIHTIAVVVLGGTALFGGRGVIFGSVIGALILGVLETGLLLARVAYFWQLVAMGILFITVVTIRTLREREQD